MLLIIFQIIYNYDPECINKHIRITYKILCALKFLTVYSSVAET